MTDLPDFEDPDVQSVYALLCSDESPPNPEQHWEGWLARRIVATIRPLVAAECARACDDAASSYRRSAGSVAHTSLEAVAKHLTQCRAVTDAGAEIRRRFVHSPKPLT